MKKTSTTKEAILFTLFSLSAGLIQLGSFALFDLVTKWNYWPKYLISVTLSVLWNFTFNRKVTFKGTNNIYLAMGLTFLFYVAFIPLSTIGGNYFETKLGVPEYIILAVTMILNFVLEFLYTKFVVYRNNKPPASLENKTEDITTNN